MTRQYFGTDGIRGRVGSVHMSPDFVLKLGWAAGRVLASGGEGNILIGKDTRISGYMFESALEAGLSAAGVHTRLLGPMPTPAIAYLTRTLRAAAGIVISASHNIYADNGIKFLGPNGEKLSDQMEKAIEAEINTPLVTVESPALGKVRRIVDASGRYIEFCKSTFPTGLSLRGIKLVIDCANGAAYNSAPNVFHELGADVVAIGVEPDGININYQCGATDLTSLVSAVRQHQADLGIALDGDGDRIILVDAAGQVIDGDQILYILAKDLWRKESLQGGVVGTVMSNLGLETALRHLGVAFKRAQVGDRHVMQQLKQQGWQLGGEPSGHIICSHLAPTGDGIIAGLQVLACMITTGCSLAELNCEMDKLPQHTVNVPLANKVDICLHPEIKQAVANAEAMLGENGRVLLRPSGTEALIRVMVEGEDDTQVRQVSQDLADRVTHLLSS